MNRFIAILNKAGTQPATELLTEENLTVLQNAIVDKRFAAPGYLTYQSVYLAQAITATILQDMTDELNFLERYDELKKDIQNLVDMPDKDIDNIILFLHQNKGAFPNRRKSNFPKVTEDEFLVIEKIYKEIFR